MTSSDVTKALGGKVTSVRASETDTLGTICSFNLRGTQIVGIKTVMVTKNDSSQYSFDTQRQVLLPSVIDLPALGKDAFYSPKAASVYVLTGKKFTQVEAFFDSSPSVDPPAQLQDGLTQLAKLATVHA
jgi:hypothetical protein